jgi:hypothetical protein
LAAFLTIKNSAQGLPDIDAAVAQNKKICLGAGLLKQYQNLFPKAEKLLYGFPDDPPFDKVGSDGKWFFEDTTQPNITIIRTCDVLVEAPKNLLKAQSEAARTPGSCTTEAHGPMINEIPLTMPVRPEIYETLSQIVANMRSDNTLSRILQKNRKESKCASGDSLASTDALGVDNMASAFVVYAFVFLVAVIIIVLKKVLHMASPKVASFVTDATDGTASMRQQLGGLLAWLGKEGASFPSSPPSRPGPRERRGGETHPVSLTDHLMDPCTLDSLLHSVTEGVQRQLDTLEARLDAKRRTSEATFEATLGKLEASVALIRAKIEGVQHSRSLEQHKGKSDTQPEVELLLPSSAVTYPRRGPIRPTENGFRCIELEGEELLQEQRMQYAERNLRERRDNIAVKQHPATKAIRINFKAMEERW